MPFIKVLLEKIELPSQSDYNLAVVSTWWVRSKTGEWDTSRHEIETHLGPTKVDKFENMYVGVVFIYINGDESYSAPIYLLTPEGEEVEDVDLISKFENVANGLESNYKNDAMEECRARKTYMQQRGTCWFNSIVNALINSERFRCWTDEQCDTSTDSRRYGLLKTLQDMMRKNKRDVHVSELIKMFGLVERMFLITDGGIPQIAFPRMLNTLGLSYIKASYDVLFAPNKIVRPDIDVLIIVKPNPLSPLFGTEKGIPRHIPGTDWVLDHAVLNVSFVQKMFEAHILTCFLTCDKPMIMDSIYGGEAIKAIKAEPYDWTKKDLDPIPFQDYKYEVNDDKNRFNYICYVNQAKLRKCEAYSPPPPPQMPIVGGSAHPTRVLATLLLASLTIVSSVI
jgi:hypothetical protein